MARNAQKLTEDVLAAAKNQKLVFEQALDNFGDGSITALVVVHAGRGAETFTSKLGQDMNIWSHKADLQKAVKVNPDLVATNYLTIPEDAKMGAVRQNLRARRPHPRPSFQAYSEPRARKPPPDGIRSHAAVAQIPNLTCACWVSG